MSFTSTGTAAHAARPTAARSAAAQRGGPTASACAALGRPPSCSTLDLATGACLQPTGVCCPSQRQGVRAPSCSSLRPLTGLSAPASGSSRQSAPNMQAYEVGACRYLPYQWALLMRALASWKAWKQGWRQRTAAYWRPDARVRAMQPPAMCLAASCLPRRKMTAQCSSLPTSSRNAVYITAATHCSAGLPAPPQLAGHCRWHAGAPGQLWAGSKELISQHCC